MSRFWLFWRTPLGFRPRFGSSIPVSIPNFGAGLFQSWETFTLDLSPNPSHLSLPSPHRIRLKKTSIIKILSVRTVDLSIPTAIAFQGLILPYGLILKEKQPSNSLVKRRLVFFI
jgi:hypothetical protein